MAGNRDRVMKGILAGITGFVDAQANKQKLAAQMMMNEMKLRSNWLWKLKTAQAEKETSRNIFQRYLQERGGETAGLQEISPAREALVPSGKPMVEGGYVGYPEGSTFREGKVFGPAGEQVGQYAPEREPEMIEYAPAQYGIDEAALLSPQARQRMALTPEGELSTSVVPIAQAMYEKLLKLEKIQKLTPQQTAMKDRLKQKLYGKIEEEEEEEKIKVTKITEFQKKTNKAELFQRYARSLNPEINIRKYIERYGNKGAAGVILKDLRKSSEDFIGWISQNYGQNVSKQLFPEKYLTPLE